MNKNELDFPMSAYQQSASSMSRQIEKSVVRDGQRRRSPRISALDACKVTKEQSHRINKRKLDDDHAPLITCVSKLAKQVWKGKDDANNSDDHIEWRSQMVKQDPNHAIPDGKPSRMPAKHILELVLDTLQRRDTCEIFAEPVDPHEVEDYYEIIEEPMDFGTMRAKLHEGMYQNLQQFEHDVFLIPGNAMHFNSSATIYFRQARAIHDLAKKVFHVLKTDPENFVSEFSGTRRRSMRKALSNTKDSIHVSSKGTLSSPSPPTFRRNTKKSPACAETSNRFYATGSRDGRLSSCEVADRRVAHWPWRSPLYNKKDHIDSPCHSSNRPLLLMNQGDISYKDSLMSYVKDLGPIAQMVAKRKLLGQQNSSSRISAATTQQKAASFAANAFKTFRDFAPGSNPFLKASNTIDLTEEANSRNMKWSNPFLKASNTIDLTEEANGRNMKFPGKEKADCVPQGKERSDCVPHGKERSDCVPHGKERADCVPQEKERAEVSLKTGSGLINGGDGVSKNCVGKDLNCSSMRRQSNRARPVILALENYHSHTNAAEYKTRNKKSCTVPFSRTGPDSAQQTQTQPLPVISRFTFDLPFLKARLNEMNGSDSISIGGELKKRPSGTLNCIRQADTIGIKQHFLYNQSKPCSSLDSNLALQL